MKLIAPPILKKFPTIYGTLMFVAVFQKAHCALGPLILCWYFSIGGVVNNCLTPS
jgi:hypothetical protein